MEGGRGLGLKGVLKQLDSWRFLGKKWKTQTLAERHEHRTMLLKRVCIEPTASLPEGSVADLFSELDNVDEDFILANGSEEPVQDFFPEDQDFMHHATRGFDGP